MIVLAICWSCAALFDTVIFLLTVFKRLQEVTVLKGGLFSVMLRDGELQSRSISRVAQRLLCLSGTLYYG